MPRHALLAIEVAPGKENLTMGRKRGDSRKPREVVKLPECFTGRGDVKGYVFRLVRRTQRIALYSRNEGVGHEVFVIPVRRAHNAFGVWYPSREVYPCSSDFGRGVAYCFWGSGSLERALTQFRTMAKE